jgi:tetratricopeptide (TPR) repeat protein
MEPYDVYEEILEQAGSRLTTNVQRITTEKRVAADNLAELLMLPLADRAAAVATEPRFQTYSLAVHTLEKSGKAAFFHPRAALELTRLARTVTLRIDPRTCGGTTALADLAAYALAREGNAQRVCGEMAVALTALSRAREAQKRGGADSHWAAQIDLMESSLRRDLGQLHTALNLLDRAAEGFLTLGERDLWAQAQINRSNVFQVQENFEQAARILEDASGQASTPHTILCIRHNMIYLLARSGRPCEAARLLAESRGLYRSFSDPLIMSRRRWVEGLIAGGLGEDRLASNLLDKVGTDLDERGYAFDAALVRLDLGKLQGRRRAEPVC